MLDRGSEDRFHDRARRRSSAACSSLGRRGSGHVLDDCHRASHGDRSHASRVSEAGLAELPRRARWQPSDATFEGTSTGRFLNLEPLAHGRSERPPRRAPRRAPDVPRRGRSKAPGGSPMVLVARARRLPVRDPRRPLERASQIPTARSAATPTERFRRPLWPALGNRRHDGPRGLNPRPPTAPGTTLRGGQEDPRETPWRAPPRPLREVSQDLSTSSVATLQGGLTDDRNTLDHHPPERPIQTLRPPPGTTSCAGPTTPSTPSARAAETTSTTLRRHPPRGPRTPSQHPPPHPPERPIQTLRPPPGTPLAPARRPLSTPSTRAAQTTSTPSATALPRGRHHPPERPIQTLRPPPAHPFAPAAKDPSRHPPRGAAQTTSTPSASTLRRETRGSHSAALPPRSRKSQRPFDQPRHHLGVGAPKAPRRAARPCAEASEAPRHTPRKRPQESPHRLRDDPAAGVPHGSATAHRRTARSPLGEIQMPPRGSQTDVLGHAVARRVGRRREALACLRASA